MEIGQEDRLHWLALHHTPGLGPVACQQLLQHFTTAHRILTASDAALTAAGAERRLIAALRETPDRQAMDRDLDWLEQPDHHLIVFSDSRYPPLLREIHDPPLLLYVCGNPQFLSRQQLAIVGSRNPLPSGAENAYEFARKLPSCGLLVTSGLALGIDGAAHHGALDGGAPTIAVTGTGLDRCYPRRHGDLARRIAEVGALVSELPIGTPPRAENFPRRNRIISGLSQGVLVAEAALHSGSLITARQALEQGREVFAMPGSIHNPLARGCHALIRQGAKLVESLEDIVEELVMPDISLSQSRATDRTNPVRSGDCVENEVGQVLAQMGHDPTALDTLVERTGLTAERLSSILLSLELDNQICALPGGLFMRRNIILKER